MLFVALCAYAGAWLYENTNKEYELREVLPVSLKDSAELCGIAVRWEQEICSHPSAAPLPYNGQRLGAGSEISGMSLECSALYYDDSDGLEYLSPDCLMNLSPSELKTIMDLEPEKPLRRGGRLIYGHSWYYASLADASLPLPCPALYTLHFDGAEESAEARLIYKSPEENGQCALIFRLTDTGEEFLSLRETEAELVFSEYYGLQLPAKAVMKDADGNEFVYTLTAGQAETKAVEIIYSSGDTCIAALSPEANALREGNMVIVSESTTDDGRG